MCTRADLILAADSGRRTCLQLSMRQTGVRDARTKRSISSGLARITTSSSSSSTGSDSSRADGPATGVSSGGWYEVGVRGQSELKRRSIVRLDVPELLWPSSPWPSESFRLSYASPAAHRPRRMAPSLAACEACTSHQRQRRCCLRKPQSESFA